MENEDKKPKTARRRTRNSKIPDPFRRAAETDSTLRSSSAGEAAPSSRRGSASVRPPSSRRGAAAVGKRPYEVTDAGAARALDSAEMEAPPASSRRSGKVSERRPKLQGVPEVVTHVSTPSAARSQSDEALLLPRVTEPDASPKKTPAIAFILAGLVVVVGVFIWRASRTLEEEMASPPAPADATSQTAAPNPPPPVATAAPTPPAPYAIGDQAKDPAQATSSKEEPAGDKKKKKKTTTKATTTATPAKSATTPTPPPTTTNAPAFEFSFGK